MEHSPSRDEVWFGSEILTSTLAEMYGIVCVRCHELAQPKSIRSDSWPYALAETGVCTAQTVTRINTDRRARQVLEEFYKDIAAHHPSTYLDPRVAIEFAHRLILDMPAMTNLGKDVLHCRPCEKVAEREAIRLQGDVHLISDLNPKHVMRPPKLKDVVMTIELHRALLDLNTRFSAAHSRHNPPKVVNLRGNETEQEAD